MNCAFVCFSKYQLMNCINIVKSFGEYKTYKKDLFISSKILVDNDINIDLIYKYNLFDNVFIYNDSNYSCFMKKIVLRIIEILNPHICIKNMLLNREDYEKVKKRYEKLFISYQHGIGIALSFITDRNNINYYDDGMASYYDDRQQHKKIRRLIYTLLFHNLNYIKPTNLYVYEKSIITDNIKHFYKKIYSIPKIKDKYIIDILNDIFSIHNKHINYDKKIIYLTQPNDDKLKSNDYMNTEILSLLSKYRENVLIRKHPRVAYSFRDYNIDTNKNLWELNFVDHLNSDMILIGNSSTAQITPKLVFDLEPTLVFTFKLYKNMYSKEVTDRLVSLLNNIKNCYRNPEKVLILSNKEELIVALNDYIYNC